MRDYVERRFVATPASESATAARLFDSIRHGVKRYVREGAVRMELQLMGDAHPEFKRVLAKARPEDIVTFMSVAGLPARAVLTPWLERYLGREKALQAHAKADPRRCVPGTSCLAVCGLRDGIAAIGQFCIDTRLALALKGDVKKGLFFRGSESLPFGTAIRPVAELLDYFLTGRMPAFNSPHNRCPPVIA